MPLPGAARWAWALAGLQHPGLGCKAAAELIGSQAATKSELFHGLHRCARVGLRPDWPAQGIAGRLQVQLAGGSRLDRLGRANAPESDVKAGYCSKISGVPACYGGRRVGHHMRPAPGRCTRSQYRRFQLLSTDTFPCKLAGRRWRAGGRLRKPWGHSGGMHCPSAPCPWRV